MCPPHSRGTKEFTVSPRLQFSGLNPAYCYRPWSLRGPRDTTEHADLCVCSDFPGSQVLHQAFASMSVVHPFHTFYPFYRWKDWGTERRWRYTARWQSWDWTPGGLGTPWVSHVCPQTQPLSCHINICHFPHFVIWSHQWYLSLRPLLPSSPPSIWRNKPQPVVAADTHHRGCQYGGQESCFPGPQPSGLCD